jgi:hypothetical protein
VRHQQDTPLSVTIHPGGNLGANLKSITHRCHPILVAFVSELTPKTIHLPLGCLQGGYRSVNMTQDTAHGAGHHLLDCPSTLDAVYAYMVSWSEFPIVPSYPHYPHTSRRCQCPRTFLTDSLHSRNLFDAHKLSEALGVSASPKIISESRSCQLSSRPKVASKSKCRKQVQRPKRFPCLRMTCPGARAIGPFASRGWGVGLAERQTHSVEWCTH